MKKEGRKEAGRKERGRKERTEHYGRREQEAGRKEGRKQDVSSLRPDAGLNRQRIFFFMLTARPSS